MFAEITMPDKRVFTITETYIATPTRTVPNPSNDVYHELERFLHRIAKSDEVLTEMRDAIQMAKDFALATFFDGDGNQSVWWEAEVGIDIRTGDYWLIG